jgi:hypothetical protein
MPPIVLRESLAEQRRLGVPFRRAWGVALRKALDGSEERQRWSDALKGTVAAWASAYAREDSTALAAFSDRSMGEGAQLCGRSTCPKALPPGSRGWCSPECKRLGEQEREARAAQRSASTALASSASETPIASAILSTVVHAGDA